MKFCVGIWSFGPTPDRFCSAGYRGDLPIEKRIEVAAGIEGLKGLEFNYPSEVREDMVDVVKERCRDFDLEVAVLGSNIFAEPRWKNGSLCAKNEKVRSAAVQRVKGAMDLAKELGSSMVVMWPGQDGYDYPFQANYRSMWDNFINSLRECLDHKSDVRIALEYKIREPRTHVILGTVGKALTVIHEIGSDRLGVNIDLGHALMVYENLAESVVLLSRYNRLFHTHWNDSFKFADDDLIAGSVHFWETLELVYWLQEVGYDGWYGLDLFPYREEPARAVQQSIKNIQFMTNLLDRVDRKEMRERIKEGDATKLQPLLREMLTKK